MSRDELIHAGKVLKVHGLDGGMVIRFDDFFHISDPFPAFLFLEVEGLPVPFAITKAEEYGENSFIVHLEDIFSRDKAAKYRGCNVWLEPQYIKITEPGNPAFRFTGFAFTDKTTGKKGQIIRHINIPGNPLLEVQTEKSSYLIPADPTFIFSTDIENKQIIFQLPEGIFGKMRDKP